MMDKQGHWTIRNESFEQGCSERGQNQETETHRPTKAYASGLKIPQ